MTDYMTAFMGLYFGTDETKAARRELATTAGAQMFFTQEMRAFATQLALYELLRQLEGTA
jgi:hypothetical protein